MIPPTLEQTLRDTDVKLRCMLCEIWIAVSISLASAPSLQAAGSCGYDHCWGGVGVGPDGISARASGHKTAPAAMERLKRICREKCTVLEIFHSGCAVIVQDHDEIAFTGFAETRKLAEADAIAACETGTSHCRTRVWACSR